MQALKHKIKQTIKHSALFELYVQNASRKTKFKFIDTKTITLISIAFNNHTIIALQLVLIKKYLSDNHELIVLDNSTDIYSQNEIKRICDKCQVPYISVPKQRFLNFAGSASHGFALNCGKNIFASCSSQYVGFLDHDIFPFRSTAISSFFATGAVVSGLLQKRESIWYIWPGFAFFDNRFLQQSKSNFMPHAGLDTRGSLFFLITGI